MQSPQLLHCLSSVFIIRDAEQKAVVRRLSYCNTYRSHTYISQVCAISCVFLIHNAGSGGFSY